MKNVGVNLHHKFIHRQLCVCVLVLLICMNFGGKGYVLLSTKAFAVC